MTKREMFTAMLAIPAIAEDDNMKSFIEHEIELIAKRSSAERKPTATQVENEKYKKIILNYLVATGEEKCIKELQAEIPEIASLSNQRITHLLSALVNNDSVRKEYKKKTPYFSAILE